MINDRAPPDDIGPSLLARICTQVQRLGGRLDADTLTLWRAAVADRNVTSPAAMGCLLALVREAWGCPTLQCGHTGGWGDDWDTWLAGNPPGRGHGCVIAGEGATEAEALVSALEEAPT